MIKRRIQTSSTPTPNYPHATLYEMYDKKKKTFYIWG